MLVPTSSFRCYTVLRMEGLLYRYLPFKKNAAIPGGAFHSGTRWFLLVLAVLVGDAAAGLAGGLARGLALAAAAVLGALAEIAGLEGGDLDHGLPPYRFSFTQEL